MDEHTRAHLHETPPVVTIPLILLAIPSVFAGFFAIGPMLFGDYFAQAITVLPGHDVLAEIGKEFHGAGTFVLHGIMQPPFWLAMAGLATAWFFTLKRPDLADMVRTRFSLIVRILENKYGFDRFNEVFFAGGSRMLGRVFWRFGDMKLIDGLLVNGTAKSVGWFSGIIRHMQTGYLYHYAFVMIIGMLLLLTWVVFR